MLVVPTNEELEIARQTLAVVGLPRPLATAIVDSRRAEPRSQEVCARMLCKKSCGVSMGLSTPEQPEPGAERPRAEGPSTCTMPARCVRWRTRCDCASSACCASRARSRSARSPQATGAASGSVSYHLSTLAKHGFVVPAPELERDGRERWWRAAHEMTSWRTEEFLDDPERREASEAMRRTVLDAYHRELLDALDAEFGLEPEWVAASDSSDGGAQLTLDEFRELYGRARRGAREVVGARPRAARGHAGGALDHPHLPEDRA